MNSIRLAAVLFAVAVAAGAAPPPGYRLAWADEFNGLSLEATNWNYRTDSKHWSTQTPGNVSVEDGNLVLTLKKETTGGMEYTGGGVISKKTFGFGYYEARFRIAAGPGWHSSFWMMRHDGSGGTSTGAATLELDVIENDTSDLTSYGINTHKWKGEHVSYGHRNVSTPSLAGYHTYGCEYGPDTVKYFFDGVLEQTVDIRALPRDEVNIWLTSIATWLGNTKKVDDGMLPGHVYYDYVRFYERSE